MTSILALALVSPVFAPCYVPNDPLAPQQWYLSRIQAYEAWDIARSTAVIADLDTGLTPHEDIASVPGWNIYAGNDDTHEVYNHGTAVAGIIGARSDNSLGVASVGFGARVM